MKVGVDALLARGIPTYTVQFLLPFRRPLQLYPVYTCPRCIVHARQRNRPDIEIIADHRWIRKGEAKIGLNVLAFVSSHSFLVCKVIFQSLSLPRCFLSICLLEWRSCMDVWGRFDLDLGQREWLARGGVLSSGQIRLSFET